MAGLHDLTVLDLDGKPHELGKLTGKKPAVLVFLRHFGWLFCREAAARFAPEKTKFEAAGAKMFFIGNGTPEHARWFVDALGLGELPVYTDPRRETYRAAGLKEGLLRVASPKSALNAVRALRKGNRQTSTKGNPWQMGGVVLLDAKGKARWTHVEENAGEIADPAAVLAEVKNL